MNTYLIENITWKDIEFMEELFTTDNVSFASYETPINKNKKQKYPITKKYLKQLVFYKEDVNDDVIKLSNGKTIPTSIVRRLVNLFITWLRNNLPVLDRINQAYYQHILKNESFLYEALSKEEKIRLLKERYKKLEKMKQMVHKKLADLKQAPTNQTLKYFKFALSAVLMYVSGSYLPKNMKIMYRIGISIIRSIISYGAVVLFKWVYPALIRIQNAVLKFLRIKKEKDPERAKKEKELLDRQLLADEKRLNMVYKNTMKLVRM